MVAKASVASQCVMTSSRQNRFGKKKRGVEGSINSLSYQLMLSKLVRRMQVASRIPNAERGIGLGF
jgi:hypothetical protein